MSYIIKETIFNFKSKEAKKGAGLFVCKDFLLANALLESAD